MIPIRSGLNVSLVRFGSMVVSMVIYDTVGPCGNTARSVFCVCLDFIDRRFDGAAVRPLLSRRDVIAGALQQ